MDFEKLNPQQIEAIKHTNGPCRVIAGAGSGKTTVLTKRIQYLLENNINPKNVLAITFTKKAAEEMKERLIKLVGKTGNDVFLGTFHSFGLKVVRYKYMRDNKKIPTLLDGISQRQLLGRILSPSTTILDKKLETELDIDTVISFISWQKNYLLFPNDDLDYSCLDGDDLTEEEAKDYKIVYKNYELLKKQENVMDFDDMLTESYQYLKRDMNLRNFYVEKYKYILVDEFQDTNVAQYQLVKLLSGYSKNIFIVGDARQAIYSWRASKVEFILNFEKDWANSKTIALNDNYRSTVEIVNISTDLIKKSTIDYPGECRSGRGNHGLPVFSFSTDNEITEADMIASLIDDFVNNQHKVDYSEIAILYRLNTQSRPFEDAFMALNIPYYVAGSSGFYGIREIKELLSYLKLSIMPNDMESFEGIINIPNRQVSKDIISKLKEKSMFFNTPILDTVKTFWNIDDNPSQEMLLDFSFTIDKIISMDNNPENNVGDILSELVKNIDYLSFIKERSKNKLAPDDSSKEDMINSFIDGCKRFEKINDLFEFIARVEEQQKNNHKNKVQLMTLHKSKGLEYKMVFVVGMVNGILPHGRSIKFDKEGRILKTSIEEERRLSYVGVTRAQEILFLSTYDNSNKGRIERSVFYSELSPYTSDISKVYNEIKNKRNPS